MKKWSMIIGMGLVSLLIGGLAFAADPATPASGTLGDLATTATGSAKGIIGLILAICYIIGLTLVIIGLLKLKAHREAPTQVPISTGIVMLLLGSAMLFLPTVISSVGKTIFGASPQVVSYTGDIQIGGSPTPAK